MFVTVVLLYGSVIPVYTNFFFCSSLAHRAASSLASELTNLVQLTVCALLTTSTALLTLFCLLLLHLISSGSETKLLFYFFTDVYSCYSRILLMPS